MLNLILDMFTQMFAKSFVVQSSIWFLQPGLGALVEHHWSLWRNLHLMKFAQRMGGIDVRAKSSKELQSSLPWDSLNHRDSSPLHRNIMGDEPSKRLTVHHVFISSPPPDAPLFAAFLGLLAPSQFLVEPLLTPSALVGGGARGGVHLASVAPRGLRTVGIQLLRQ